MGQSASARAVPLYGKHGRGRVARVDPGDYADAMAFRWWVQLGKRGRAESVVANRPRPAGPPRRVTLHHLITGWARVDHRDGDPLNCTRANMREATAGQNNANRGPLPGSSSPYKGVSWDRARRQWEAQIKLGYRGRRLGRFPGTPEGEIAAAKAYDTAARELHGAFAWLNAGHFPEVA